MDKIDIKLAETLTPEEAAAVEPFGEQGPIAGAFGVFHGKAGWIGWVAILMSIGLIGIGIYAIVQILAVEDPVSAVRWGVLLVLVFTGQMMVKQWSWMRMESNRIMREVKRLELLLAMRR